MDRVPRGGEPLDGQPQTHGTAGVKGTAGTGTLEVRGVSKAFGGIQAVEGMDLVVRRGEIVTLIGPNGAGKTTLLNLISGFYRPDAGEILYDGKRIDGLSPDQVTAAGIARTFQSLRLFAELSVLDNVMVAQHHRLGVGWLAATLRLRRYRMRARQLEEEALASLSFFGRRLLGYRLPQPVRVLSYANRRRVEMARAMSTGARLLLLDEPSAGMNPRETQEIADLILRMRDELGFAVLLVEHKMNLVERVSDRVVAMDFGKKLAEGAYRDVVTDPRVVESYLGRPLEEDEAIDGVDAGEDLSQRRAGGGGAAPR